ncbi:MULTISPECIES: group-specific protein [unclassified Lysinibacillus]|uniref:group-specific protein n=1 Tax=unclassified Lysinibacillus TaxID=2636778 RepID=UPI0025534C4C|nr:MULTISPECIES: group-specific protein [unclassified Lysinibacillus]MDM5248864.1 group-specific protein [Lysinibacillus sp. G4S2]
MGIGFIVSFIVVGIWSIIILGITIPMDKKYVVRENGKINYKKTTIYLRWNVFDTLTLVLAIYTILCVQAVFILLTSSQTIENPYMQFFANQSSAWVIVIVGYLVSRVSITLKSIKAHWGDELDDEQ